MQHSTELGTLPTLSRQVIRLLMRHRRLVTALLVSATVLAVANLLAPQSPATRTVVVAAHDLAAGATLTGDDVRILQLEPRLTPSGAATSASAVVGRIVAGPMRAGEVVTDQRIVGTNLLEGYPHGLVGTPLRLADADVATMLEVGDQVDVYAATGDITTSAERVVVNARIVALHQPRDQFSEGVLLMLALTDSQAGRLAQAIATTQVSVVLRAPP